jgi:hypothetical protein
MAGLTTLTSVTLNDEQKAYLERWWQRRSDAERAALIEHRREEFSADYWPIVMEAEPVEPNQPPIVAIVSDNRTGRFRLPPIIVEHLEHRASWAT